MTALKTDCLILGGGLSGRMAAREAVKAGLDVLMVQDGMGASPWVHGFNVPLHPEDSVACFLRDTAESGQGLSDPGLAAALCGDAEEVFEELRAMGLSFNREGDGYQMLRPLGASHPRVVSIGNETGVAVLRELNRELCGRVRELSHTRALRLLKQKGRVCGALAFDVENGQWRTISAKAVVLACGGFCGIYPMSTNKRDSGGDGVAMAFEAGAELCDMEFIQFEPSAAVWPKALVGTSMITTLFFEGAVLRNRQGERFMLRYGPEAERVNKDVMARRIAAEIAQGNGTEHGGVYFDATGVSRELLREKYAMYLERYRAVDMDLAGQWIELAPAPHTSLGGVRVDPDGSATVAGLFACGEVTGGLHGANRIGGSAGLETLVFGRRAGRGAVRFAKAAEDLEIEERFPETGGVSIADRLQSVREDMRTALWQGINVLRDGPSLQKARRVLETERCELRGLRGADEGEAFALLRLENDMTAALLLCEAAMARERSLGCHVRRDAPCGAEAPYRVVLKNDGRGGVELRKESVNG